LVHLVEAVVGKSSTQILALVFVDHDPLERAG
jgi:hypothetical protein